MVRPGVWVVLCLSLAAAPAHAQAGAILGTWRGTSVCAKESWNSACNDEQVIYDITRAPDQPDSIAIDAQKVVNGVAESMGVITVGYDSAAKAWAGIWSNARYRLLWTFEVRGTVLSGTLQLLPDRRVARHISARKD